MYKAREGRETRTVTCVAAPRLLTVPMRALNQTLPALPGRLAGTGTAVDPGISGQQAIKRIGGFRVTWCRT